MLSLSWWSVLLFDMEALDLVRTRNSQTKTCMHNSFKVVVAKYIHIELFLALPLRERRLAEVRFRVI